MLLWYVVDYYCNSIVNCYCSNVVVYGGIVDCYCDSVVNCCCGDYYYNDSVNCFCCDGIDYCYFDNMNWYVKKVF
jgi:hypothetical protein